MNTNCMSEILDSPIRLSVTLGELEGPNDHRGSFVWADAPLVGLIGWFRVDQGVESSHLREERIRRSTEWSRAAALSV